MTNFSCAGHEHATLPVSEIPITVLMSVFVIHALFVTARFQLRGRRIAAEDFDSPWVVQGPLVVDAAPLPTAAPLAEEAELWQRWSWKRPIESSTPLHSCKWAALRPPATAGLPMPANASICLRLNDDLLCNAVLAHGHWPECADLPELYRRARADGGIVVDAGANIGACTLHMLLTTDAHVLAFEPGADNLFYFSSSLMQLREFFTNAEQHLQLYPLAVGAANVSDELHATIGNA
eukprot:CAMPEP_0119321848 /NCGR_PEP_ID=MMETSP1333-20130426/56611_1 /TAXON_ID=418940 /ORGANISM="Scyphosphaera apsteinii, Strain RCC1455" /LENGTH=235 /DNA_ID=CAMNT_0007328925 /DNA_START=8 /DNA_END=713 /DNA_ORIENTATION=+